MTHRQQIKLERLRKDIQDGLDSGESAPLDIEEIKAEGRAKATRPEQAESATLVPREEEAF